LDSEKRTLIKYIGSPLCPESGTSPLRGEKYFEENLILNSFQNPTLANVLVILIKAFGFLKEFGIISTILNT
jgi:hypothetical protein